jgi:DNA-binding GntR family transcriptional regulator
MTTLGLRLAQTRVNLFFMEMIAPLFSNKAASVANSLRLPGLRRRAGETMGEFVHRRLRHAIMTGRFPPGEAVTIRGLASLLGTSAMPVREAMRRLAAEHALELLDNRRARVPDMNLARFTTLIEARVLLERAAAVRAMHYVDAPKLAELRRLDNTLNDVFGRGDIERTIESNLVFHRRLYMIAPDDAMTPLIESIWLQIGPFMRAALQESAVYYNSDRHDEALSAIMARDGVALARAIEADIRDGIGHLSARPEARAA